MRGFLRELLGVAVLVFSVTTMLSVGLGHTLHHVFGPMRDQRAVIRALLANFVIVPMLAFGVVQVLPLDPSYETGLMLIGTAAGSPFLVRLTAAAGGNVPLSASLLMLLLPATVLYMPLVIPLVVADVRMGPIVIARPLFLTLILPLAAGLLVRAFDRAVAERLRPGLAAVSTVSLATAILATIAADTGDLARMFVEGAVLAPAVVILGGFGTGFVLGREYRGGHVVLGLGTAQRNIAAALVVATQEIDDQDAVTMVVAASLANFALLFPIAWILRRRTLKQESTMRV